MAVGTGALQLGEGCRERVARAEWLSDAQVLAS